MRGYDVVVIVVVVAVVVVIVIERKDCVMKMTFRLCSTLKYYIMYGSLLNN